jgi:alanine racemase
MKEPASPTWAEIDLSALGRNFARLRARAGARRMIGVVKANAYGHGAIAVARALAGAGCDHLAVASLDEASELVDAGIEVPILLLQGIRAPEEAEAALRPGLVPLVCSLDMLEPLAAAAELLGRPSPVHLKIDTGMGRLGLLPEELEPALERLRRSPRLRLEGVASHLAEADDPESPETRKQRSRFTVLVARVRSAGFEPTWLHLDNSAGIVHGPTPVTTAVRAGLALYGGDPTLDRSAAFEPVMTLLSLVSHAKQVPAGARIGYGGTYVVPSATRILTLPIGYADGFPRSAAARFRVGVGSERRPLAGRISMDLATVDAGPDSEAGVGDPVLIFGRTDDLEIRVEELADAAGTISYEILVGIGSRVPRRA